MLSIAGNHCNEVKFMLCARGLRGFLAERRRFDKVPVTLTQRFSFRSWCGGQALWVRLCLAIVAWEEGSQSMCCMHPGAVLERP